MLLWFRKNVVKYLGEGFNLKRYQFTFDLKVFLDLLFFNSLPFQLTDENEQLVKKVKKLHIKNKELERNLGQIQEQLYLQQLMHVCGTSRE